MGGKRNRDFLHYRSQLSQHAQGLQNRVAGVGGGGLLINLLRDNADAQAVYIGVQARAEVWDGPVPGVRVAVVVSRDGG